MAPLLHNNILGVCALLLIGSCSVVQLSSSPSSGSGAGCRYKYSNEFSNVGIPDYALESSGLVSVSKIDQGDAGTVDANGVSHFGTSEIILMSCQSKTHVAINQSGAEHFSSGYVSSPSSNFFNYYMGAARQNNATDSFSDFANFARNSGILQTYISAVPRNGYGIMDKDAQCICNEFAGDTK